MIIVDTSIWSIAYRRRKIQNTDIGIVKKLYALLEIEQEILIGPVRQELLSGISDKNVFKNLITKLDGFNNYEIQLADHDLAAEYYNVCLKNGIQGSQTDYLICAVAYRYDMKIFTEDKDFKNYQKFLPVKLFS